MRDSASKKYLRSPKGSFRGFLGLVLGVIGLVVLAATTPPRCPESPLICKLQEQYEAVMK